MKKNRYIALLAGLSLVLMSSPALAYPSADTLLVSGYDVEEGVVLYGTSSIDQEGDETTLDCSLDGDYVYVSDLESGDAENDVTELFEYDSQAEEPGDEATFESEDDDSTDAPVAYSDPAAEDCGLTAVTIEHPGDGEINHGTIVSTFARLLQGGNGCLIRLFAQSDYGKADYVVDEGAEALSVVLSSHETACKKGPGAAFQAEGDDDDSRGGPPPWAGKKGVEGDDDTSRGGPPPWAGKKKGNSES